MTDKEFKRLSRSQLIEIIYQFQIKEEELTKENQTLKAALDDKRLRISQAGNIAEAALQVNNVMQSAQNAAQQYLDEIRALQAETEEACQTIREKAAEEAAALIEQAKTDAAAIIAQARMEADAVFSQAQAETAAVTEPMQAEEPVTVEAETESQQEATEFEEKELPAGSDE